MKRGENGGGVAQASVSTLLVLATILSAFVPFAGLANPAVALRAPILLSERGIASPSESLGSSSTPVVSSAPPLGVNFDYLVTILMENKGICDILLSCGGSAPYLTSLAAASGLATNYHGCTFPSLGDYLCITAASTFGCNGDSPPNSDACTRRAWNATNLVDRLAAANLTWKAYMEAMPSNCFSGNQYPYAVKHNPFVYYGDISTNASRCARVVPSGASNQVLLSDLGSTANASNYMWFTPNLCHDMHDCNVTAGDNFLSGLVPQILHSTVFQTQRAALLITFDEDGGGRGSPDIYTVWAGPSAKPGFQSNVPYNHYSALRTIEANWNLAPLNANDSGASPMTEFFLGPPSARFVTSPTWPKGNTTVLLNASSSSSNEPNTTLQYRWDWTNDGTWDTNWSSKPTAQHVYGSSGVYTAAVQVKDVRGTDNTTRVVSADDAPPVTTASLAGTLGLNGWYKGNVTVTLSATDDRSGVAYTTYHLDGGPSQTYVNPIVVSANGNHTLTFHSADRAGNVEVHKNPSFRNDGVAPITAVAFTGTLNGTTFVTPILVTLSATDAVSGVAGTLVQVDGRAVTNYTVPFLVSNVGLHSVHYHSIDVAGNIEPTNSFAVINGTISDIPLVSRAVLNGTAGSSGWYTSPVTVTLQLVNGTSPPDSIWYHLDGGAWTLYGQPFVVNGDGVHSLDFNATNGIGLVEVVHHEGIQVDTTAPVTTSAVAGTLGNSGWYVSSVTVSLNASDATSGVANIRYRIDGSAWRVYTGPFVLTEGQHAVDFYATDLAGLVEPMRSRNIDVDTTAPATTADISGTLGNNNWYVSTLTVFLDPTDATSGVASALYRVDGGAWTSYAGPFVVNDGRHLIEYAATDNAGLSETARSRSVNVDTSPPATIAALSGNNGANGWFVSAVTVSLNASDASSGVANTSYRIDAGVWTVYTGPFVLGDGHHTVDYVSSDHAGLTEAMHSLSIAIDTTPPATTAAISGTPGANGWYTSNVVVSLTPLDSGSGIATLYLQIDGGPWGIYSGPVTLADGTHVVGYHAANVAGLTESTHSMSFGVDTAAPTTAMSLSGTSGANGWYISNVTVSLTATDAISGVAVLTYRIDNGSWLAYSGSILLGEGRHLLEYGSSDVAGNVEIIHSRNIAVDLSPPVSSVVLSGTQGANGWYLSDVTVTLTATDSMSGVAPISYRLDGGGWNSYTGPFSIAQGGTHILEFVSVDVAGNRGRVVRDSVHVETSKPYFLSLSGNASASTVRIIWSAADNDSGISGYELRVDDGSFASVGTATSVMLNLSNGAHVIQVKALDRAGQSTIGTLSVQVLSASGAPFGSLFILVGPLAVGTLSAIAFHVWRTLRRRQEKSP